MMYKTLLYNTYGNGTNTSKAKDTAFVSIPTDTRGGVLSPRVLILEGRGAFLFHSYHQKMTTTTKKWILPRKNENYRKKIGDDHEKMKITMKKQDLPAKNENYHGKMIFTVKK